ncbi:MAG: cell division protein FtsZ, partial [Alphaproteobacteria bacterium]|nr:cell division protein FtsZ [Alphaproteobacteria bacterium]
MKLELGIPDENKAPKNAPGVNVSRIAVVGVGGAGGNAVNNMVRSHIEGVDFITANTDAQALEVSKAPTRIQLGPHVTNGLGCGANAELGRAAAEESIEDINALVGRYDMVFIAAGMGGGTGTGAAPVIARAAREHGALTIGIVTTPFGFEGAKRARSALNGVKPLQDNVDSLIVIPNQNLFRIADEHTTFAEAFNMADDVLYYAIRSITDLIVLPGLINLDFADVKTVMQMEGRGMMGVGEANGERRAERAAEQAIANPLLDISSIRDAQGVMINITGGEDMTLYEIDEATNRIRQEVPDEALIIFGSAYDASLRDAMRVSVIATGLATPDAAVTAPQLPHGQKSPRIARAPKPEPTRAARPEIVMPQAPAPEPKDAEAETRAIDDILDTAAKAAMEDPAPLMPKAAPSPEAYPAQS